MDLPDEKLCTNKNFILKFVVLVCGISVIFFDRPVLSRMVNGCELSYLTIISALLITYMFSESTSTTEVCLLLAALFQVIEATVAHIYLSEVSDGKFYLHLTLNILVTIIIGFDIFLLAKAKITRRDL